MPELELKSVNYQYRGNRRNVLNQVSCAFERGEVTAVIGPSGSGKTTLLSLMAGLDEPTGNLDGENSRNIVSLLTELAHKNDYCVIIVTHDMAIAEAADKVYRMEDGVLTLNEGSIR